MMNRTPTVWMNVTTSNTWTRPAVGIVRVEKELTEGLEALIGKNNFKRCVWVQDRFVDLDAYSCRYPASTPAPVQTVQVPDPLTEVPLMFPLLPKKAALLALAQAVLSLTPASVRPALNRALMAAKGRLKRYLQNRSAGGPIMAPFGEQVETKSGHGFPGAEFKAGDILISIGLDWDYPYWRSFSALRKTYGLKIVTCCYDLIPVLYPQYCVSDVARRFTGYFIDVAEGSDLTLCISQQSEKDLKKLLFNVGGVDVPTHIFPLGDNVPEGAGDISAAVAELVNEPYIMFVSTIERRKNHEVLYRAYHLLCAQGVKDKLPKLVFVGMPGWGVSELLMDIQLDPLTQGKIIQLNHVTDSDLGHLYKHAQFFVFPSLYEGWGLPVGEALAMGKAVLCSDRGSLPEVGGELVRYVDPWSPNAWAEEIFKLSTDLQALADIESRVRTQYKVRSWHDACLSVKGALDQLIEKPFSMSLLAGHDMTTEVGYQSGAWIKGLSSPGLLIAGHGWSVPAGSYHLELYGGSVAPNTRIKIEVVSDAGKKIHAVLEANLDATADLSLGSIFACDFNLDSHTHALEFRCFLRSGNFNVQSIQLQLT